MTVKRKKDSEMLDIFLTKVADVPGGVSIKSSVLTGGIIKIGTVVGPKNSGVCDVLKTAKVVSGGSTTAIRVEKGHHFAIGDFAGAKLLGKAYAITAIATDNADYDVITVGTAIDNPVSGEGFLYQMAAEAASNTSAFAVTPYAVVGSQIPVDVESNGISDAWAIATVKSGYLGASIVNAMKGIVEL